MTARRPGSARRSPVAAVVIVAVVVLVALLVPGGPAELLSRLGIEPADAAPQTTSQPGSWDEATDAPVEARTADSAPTVPTASLALLDTLAVKGRAPKTGYDRVERFGTAWFDVDRNGCDTRNDVLARDLTDEVLAGRCKVMSGVLLDPYTGTTIDFVRGAETSPLVQIDHVVPLSDAWQKGAQQLDYDQRVSLANDPLNLLAVDGPTNSSKGDGDAATWLPPQAAARCDYAARQVAVKAAYALWVTPAEHDALAGILTACGDPIAPVSPFAGR